jgi:hypothetical protein
MAVQPLSENFRSFFSRLNPGASFEETASTEYSAIKDLIENAPAPTDILSPNCFLQGSYRQQTAIYTINDVDIVALCKLWFPGSGVGRSFSRDEIFELIARPLRQSPRYAGKVRYGAQSMCIKVDLKILVEILPVVYKAGNDDPAAEPFKLFRPETGKWEDGFARYHQQYLSMKNSGPRTGGNFIPAIKVFKHLRSHHGLDAVSFHIECLLYALPDDLFFGGPADYIPSVLNRIASVSADRWYNWRCMTPSGDRDIFTVGEWCRDSWIAFHRVVSALAPVAEQARASPSRGAAIAYWQRILGSEFFPQL